MEMLNQITQEEPLALYWIGTNLMCLAISWIMSTEQFASVRMIEFHTDARRCVAMSRGIDQVDALQFLMENVLKLDKKSTWWVLS